ncbi:hypothetical protein [Desulfococcus sp.]|uniref:hypothetical protein n=1 Tax=Desulfococcus sp. TaxID=2025834 RepID=UPI0035936DC4
MESNAIPMELWREVGWNGVRLSVPVSWHPSGIAADSLVFEKDASPVLTLKWEPARSRDAFRPGISRIRKGLPGNFRRTLRGAALPDPWRQALDGRFEEADVEGARAFAWGGRAGGGEGLLLGSRQTRRVFLLHFHRVGSAVHATLPPGVLASFRDGACGGRILWAVYDIRAELPEALRLVRHRFMPGAFELVFRAGAATVRLCRWGPASVLLRNTTLQAFASTRFTVPSDRFERDPAAGAEAVRWMDGHAPPRALQRLIQAVLRRQARMGKAWRLPGENKILAVQIEAGALPPGNVLDDLCGSFHCLPPGGEGPAPPP